jgi:uncharacterized membrane protein
MEIVQFLLRWVHLLAGVTWIGLLYYFNFVQTPFFAETEAGTRTGAIQKLVPRALWWFRWGAMYTFLAGLIIWLIKLSQFGGDFFSIGYGMAITIGATMGTLMFLNVWLVIWPNQQVVIASANKVAEGGEALPDAASKGQWAGFASRTNVLFSAPMVFLMAAASHYPHGESSGNMAIFWIVSFVIIAIVELNALVGNAGGGTKKLLISIPGTIWSGMILTAVFWILLEIA